MLLFTLKKFIGVLLTPLNITLILLLLAIILVNYNKKLSKLFLVSGFLVLFVSSTPFFSNPLIKPIEQSHSVFTQQKEPLDYIVVLGCSHVTNPELPVIAQLKVCSLQRLMEAHRIFQLHPEATLITSGYAHLDPVSNAQKVKQAAVSIGIPSEKIIIEERPRDTKEEAMFLSPLLKGKKFALVTNADHMPRAYRYFHQQTLSPIAAPAGFMYKGEPQDFRANLPRSSVLQQTTRALYETLGRIAQQF
jgi:uncharacterized SAM-binding protein YcdF (DUF218 family)